MAKYKQVHKPTAQENFKRLQQKQIDPIELSRDINSIAFLTDIIEGRLSHINDMLRKAGEFQFSDAIYIKNVIHYAKFMQKSTSRLLGTETAGHFGDKCDFIDEVIQIIGDANTEEQRIKVLSTLKTIIK